MDDNTMNGLPDAAIDWNISGDIYCPNCQHIIDFTEEDDWYFVCKPGENKKFDPPIDMECPKCKTKFRITESNY